MADITLQQAQQMVDAWIKTYGVRYFNELTNMTILTEEVGELARIMARMKRSPLLLRLRQESTQHLFSRAGFTIFKSEAAAVFCFLRWYRGY